MSYYKHIWGILSYYITRNKVKEGMDMCIKRCSCSGIVKNYKGNTYADICPKGKLKHSFVTFHEIFRSLTVEKPNCYSIGNVDYLTTGGTGLLNFHGKEIEGLYTLILADTGSQTDRFAFEFLATLPSGSSVAVFISFAANVTVCKCKRCKKMKKQADKTDKEMKVPIDLSHFGNYARMLVFHPNGRVDEEDLIGCSYYK